MEIPLSQVSSRMPFEGSEYWSWPERGSQESKVGCPGRTSSHVRPLTSEGHNFFVRTPFWVFLDSMETPLSQDSIRMPLEGIGFWIWTERGSRASKVGCLGRTA